VTTMLCLKLAGCASRVWLKKAIGERGELVSQGPQDFGKAVVSNW
jgi:sulfur transfer protein SufE